MTAARPAIWPPSPQETLLLRAGLLPPDAAREAWALWRSGGGDLDGIEAGSFRLLPLIYRNLEGRLDDRDEGLLKGIYRRSWATNQVGLRIGAGALRGLESAGIETLVLKGAALGELAYLDGGARPMGDLDIAVPAARVGDAIEALTGAGFEPACPTKLLEVRHSLGFSDSSGYEVDLHRRMLWRPGLDEEFWGSSVPLTLAGIQTRALCPTDQLLHVCVHGAAWNSMAPVRWAADGFKVIEAAEGALEWDRLCRLARRARLTPPLADALGFLRDELGAPIPADAVRALAATEVTRTERRAHEALAQPPSARRSAAMLWWFWERYGAEQELASKRRDPIGFMRYLQGFWGLERVAGVPGHAWRRLLSREGRATASPEAG